MADSDNYFKVRDGKQSKEFFFCLKTFGVAYRSALQHQTALTRAGSLPVLSVYSHPSHKARALLPPEVQCVGGCDRCAPLLPGVDPDADDN